MGKSWSQTIQQDQSVKAAADVGNLLGQGATSLQSSNSLVVTGRAGEITYNAFPEAVQNSVASLISAVDKALSGASSVTSQLASTLTSTVDKALSGASSIASQSTSALSEKLSEQNLGDTSILPKLALYGLLAVVAIIIGRRVLK